MIIAYHAQKQSLVLPDAINKQPAASRDPVAPAHNIALVIENERAMASLLAQVIAQEGMIPYIRHSAEAADAFVRSRMPELILLDLLLHTQSGAEWLGHFRQRNRETIVIVVSAISDVATKATLLARGADDYIAKPFDISELRARIAAARRRHQIGKSAMSLPSSIMLDPCRHLLSISDVGIKLTPIEFGILWHLATHMESWVSVRELSNAVYGVAEKQNIDDVRVHISRVREKLSLVSDEILVETRRFRGYMLTDTR